MNRRLAALAGLALGLAGCGSGGSSSEPESERSLAGPPQVTIAWPTDGTHVVAPSILDIIASASDPGGNVARVEFFADGELLGDETTSPYVFRWAEPPAGAHWLSVVVHDDEGHTTTSPGVDVMIENAENRRPAVSVSSPVDGAHFTAPAQVTFETNATDADGEVVRVDFFVGAYPVGSDESAPFTFTWNAPPGEHSVSAVATDDAGAIGSSPPITIFVANELDIIPENEPPQVSFTRPDDGADLGEAPADVQVEAHATDIDGTVLLVYFYADDTLIGSDDTEPFLVTWEDVPAGTHELRVVAIDDGFDDTASTINVTLDPPDQPDPPPGGFAVSDVRMGDPDVCYNNPEISDDSRYMVWGERIQRLNDNGEGILRMWHCAIDQATGEFIPSDCKGFSGFDSTMFGRAYVGRDRQGVFYLGADEDYRLTMTRITGANTGETIALGSLADTERRAIYPTVMPDSDKTYAYWLKSHGPNVTPAAAEWVELRYVDIDDPTHEIVVEHQENTDGLVPMDITFPRWAFRKPLLIYGRSDAQGRIDIWQLDASQPALPPEQLTSDWHRKGGPFPVVHDGQRYIIAAVDGTTESYVYAQPQGGGMYQIVETFAPPANETFPAACVANSNETFIRDGRLFTSYAVADCSDGEQDVFAFFTEPGEVWMTELLDASDEQWRLSETNTYVRNEPEPAVGSSDAWVFYTAYPEGFDQNTACFEVHRTSTPAP
jgi:hypothetical protein